MDRRLIVNGSITTEKTSSVPYNEASWMKWFIKYSKNVGNKRSRWYRTVGTEDVFCFTDPGHNIAYLLPDVLKGDIGTGHGDKNTYSFCDNFVATNDSVLQVVILSAITDDNMTEICKALNPSIDFILIMVSRGCITQDLYRFIENLQSRGLKVTIVSSDRVDTKENGYKVKPKHFKGRYRELVNNDGNIVDRKLRGFLYNPHNDSYPSDSE